jgi:hypothetical protein
MLGNLVAGLRSKPAVCIVLPAKTEVRTHRNKVYIQTLIASTVLAQTVASKVFKVYAPALLGWRVSCKVMLSVGRPFTDSGDILPDFGGQIIDVMRIPGIVLVHGAALGESRRSTANQKDKGQCQGSDCHATLLASGRL